MKIIVNADGVIWNENLPVFAQYKKEVIVVKYASPESFKPAHDGFTYLVADPRMAASAGSREAKKEALFQAGEKLLELIGDDTDVVLLTDNDPVSFYPFEYLRRKLRTRRMHLLSALPFSYESKRKKEEIKTILSDLNAVRSLCLVELDRLLISADSDETMGRLQIRIRKFLQELLVYAIEQLPEMDAFHQYLFDPESGRYVETDLGKIWESESAGASGPAGISRQRNDAGAEITGEDRAQRGVSASAEADADAEGSDPPEDDLSENGIDDADKAARFNNTGPAGPGETSESRGLKEAEEAKEQEETEEKTGPEAETAETGEEGRSNGKNRERTQPKEVEITYKHPTKKPSLFARIFGKK